jgi:predicted ATPase
MPLPMPMPDALVVITGGPGAGKTTLLHELARLGYGTVDESARAIISERLARRLSPRPEPAAFADAILRRDIEKYERARPILGRVFFDRSVIEALGMVQEACPERQHEVARLCAAYRFHPLVFVLPPWEAIYRNDAERDQSFADAVVVHDRIVRWYEACGYTVRSVPPLPVDQRARQVLSVLDGGLA